MPAGQVAVVRGRGGLPVADERPVVLVLEDLHWADIETLAVVDYLADVLPDAGGWCVVTTRQSEAWRNDTATPLHDACEAASARKLRVSGVSSATSAASQMTGVSRRDDNVTRGSTSA